MKEELEILVVEDQPKHLADVKAVLEGRKQYGIGVDYVSTLDAAKRKLEEKGYDGILSDVFFPEREGGEEAPSGLLVAKWGIDNRVPFILVTSTYHHGKKTDEVCTRLRKEVGVSYISIMLDTQPIGCHINPELEAHKKNWEGGFLALMYFIKTPKESFVWDEGLMFMRGVMSSIGAAFNGHMNPDLEQGDLRMREAELQRCIKLTQLTEDQRQIYDHVVRTYCLNLFS